MTAVLLDPAYSVTGYTRDGTRVWCDLVGGFLVLVFEPRLLVHGPHLTNVYASADADPQLFGVTVTKTRTIR